LGKLFKF